MWMVDGYSRIDAIFTNGDVGLMMDWSMARVIVMTKYSAES